MKGLLGERVRASPPPQVAQQCKENIFAIQTLKDFQFVEENKDQGLNVREKAKAMVSLLKVGGRRLVLVLLVLELLLVLVLVLDQH